MGGCLVVVLALTIVGEFLAAPVWLYDVLAAQTPSQRPGVLEWVASSGLATLTALAVVWTGGRRRPGRGPSLAVQTAVLLGLCTAVALWTRNTLETDNYTLEGVLESLAAGFVAVLFRRGVRGWERTRPLPGEVWLARVPFRERAGVSQHYCVIVGRRSGHAEVLQITSQNKDTRDDFVRMPNERWDSVSGKDHWLEIGLPPRRVPYTDFLKPRPQGPCPRTTWRQLRSRRPRTPGRAAAYRRAGRSPSRAG
ncbi:hypothetical protein [Streptomyces pratensis]|uniref:hypothetical protein n=1 Tax=Streptomyces pratensis TaxID=1169025 RepID=UPI0019343EEE|nr:hypothetical protein [Streptomyces pratensis]